MTAPGRAMNDALEAAVSCPVNGKQTSSAWRIPGGDSELDPMRFAWV